IFLLGSSDYSAQLAGQIGAAFSFAHHFATFDAAEAMRLYRDNFRASASHAEAAEYAYTPADRARIAQNRARMAVGSPATVLARLKPLIASTKADELMVTTMIFDHGARKQSYRLLAQAFDLAVIPGRGL